jgi:AraC-like DNA-binding protein
MQPLVLSLFYLISAVTGILAGSILIFYRRDVFHPYNYFQGSYFIGIGLGLICGFLYLTDLIYETVHLYRMGTAFVYIALPCSYFYMRSILKGGGLSSWDFLLFLPLVVYLVDFFPFFILPAASKLGIIEATKASNFHTMAYEEGWMTGPWIHLYMRQAFALFIWLLQLKLLLSANANLEMKPTSKKWHQWLWLNQTHQVFFWLPTIVFAFVGIDALARLFTEGIPIFAFLLIHLYLFFHPSLLYGVEGDPPEVIQGSKLMRMTRKPSRTPDTRIKAIMAKLSDQIQDSRAYLVPGYALHNLANDLDESPRMISSILNTHLQTNFNEYINRHRIGYCLDLIEKGVHQNKTIEGLAQECGFSNRTTFINAFKHFKGVTPSHYIKNLSKDSKLTMPGSL